MKKLNLILLITLFLPAMCWGQKVAVKTNALYLATTTPNLSIEWAPSSKISLDLQGSYNAWEYGHKDSNKKMKHWMIQPEVRFWMYEKFDGHFLGIHPFFIYYNAGNMDLPLDIWQGLRENRYQGHGTGLGFSYGYQWYLAQHWNLEFEFGFGYAYLDYDRYKAPKCGSCLGSGHKHYLGPTKVGLSIVYLFPSKK